MENTQQPGVAITSFTQEEINSGQISYVHRGSPSGRLALRVSDGVESGATAVLRISAFELQIFLVNNTGLVVPTNGSAWLTAANLTFSTNALDQDLEIKFEMTRAPQFGAVQMWRNNRWQTVTSFTGSQLQHDRIRYIHLHANPTQDDFHFAVVVTEAEFRSPTIYQFRVQFLTTVLRVDRNVELHIKGSNASIIGWLGFFVLMISSLLPRFG